MNTVQKQNLILSLETLLSLYNDKEKSLNFWSDDNFQDDLYLVYKLLNLEYNQDYSDFFCGILTAEEKISLIDLTNEEVIKDFIFRLL